MGFGPSQSINKGPSGPLFIKGSDGCHTDIVACARVILGEVGCFVSPAEWRQYIFDALPYQAVCKNLPIEFEEQWQPHKEKKAI